MLQKATSIQNLPIFSASSGRKLAQVFDIVINPDDGNVLAFTIEPKKVFSLPKVISPKDIWQFSVRGIIIKDDNSIINVNEIVRVEDVLSNKIEIIKSKVYTEGDKYLGRVKDFVINTNFFCLDRIYIEKPFIKGLLDEGLSIPRQNIVSIEKNKIIVKNDFLVKEKNHEKEAVYEPAL